MKDGTHVSIENVLTWIFLALTCALMLLHTHEAASDPVRLHWHQPMATAGDSWEFEFAEGPVWPTLIPLDWQPIEAKVILPDLECFAGTVTPPADGYVRLRALRAGEVGSWSNPRAVPEMDFALGALLGAGALGLLYSFTLRRK